MMPVESVRPFEASELIDYTRRRWDPRALEGLRQRLQAMNLPETPNNMAIAVHLSMVAEFTDIEAMIDRLGEKLDLMDSLELNNGSIHIETRVPREDWKKFNEDLYTLIGLADKILNRWHRFVQACAVIKGEKR
jgi:hypothetical protein